MWVIMGKSVDRKDLCKNFRVECVQIKCTVIDKNVAYDESNTVDAKWHYLVVIVLLIINEWYFFAIV